LELTGQLPTNMWLDTKKINKYTGLPNKVYWFNSKEHSTVYKRRGGWSYTSRIPLGNRWIQESLGSHHYLPTEEEAMTMAITSMLDLKNRLE
jgi:hypothetical protein